MSKNKPNSPLELLAPHIKKYWDREFNDEQILQRLQDKNIFDKQQYGGPDNALEYNVFKWVFIPWFQAELDAYIDLINTTKKRAQKHKVLPHRPPDDIDEHPENYNMMNFKVLIDLDADFIQIAEQLFAPPDHPVFQLVPPAFNHWISQYYNQLRCPEIICDNVWSVYEGLLRKFQSNAPLTDTLDLYSYHNDREEFVEEVRNALNTTVGVKVEDLNPLRYDEESGNSWGGGGGGVQGGLDPEVEDTDLADAVAQFLSDEEHLKSNVEDM
ncbi:hypothetical protein GYMLUDRAFT_247381 [Collybiopsis luxurians FD-317 M1]|uniref:Uncharacterized protein n=1 Tax=Collybiopsis luxurians FD-317 M1 TaxID=944289 RepID=A0A0D0C3Y0_9AGAR|nr:hypothetical protein GYMLUDRAFT_247381 [Collybiopsis luxurians FD-317 M1]